MEKSTSNPFQLSIRIDPNGFSLSVFEREDSLISTNRIDKPLNSMSLSELLSVIQNEINLNVSSTRIIIESELYVIIPIDLFFKEEASDFLFLEHKPAKTDSILFNKIPELKIVNVFAVPGIVLEAFNQLLPNTPIEHHISQIITENVKSNSDNCVYCSVRKKKFDVVVTNDGKLQLINSFTFETTEDLVYYLLNMYEKLGLYTEKCPVYLLNVDENPDRKKMLEKYLIVKTTN